MSSFWKQISGKSKLFLKFLQVAGSIAAIFYFFPKTAQFTYDYEKGKPWQYEDLYAPFDFPLLKSSEQLEEERQQVVSDFIPHFTVNKEVKNLVLEEFTQVLEEQADTSNSLDEMLIFSAILIDSLYEKGVLDAIHRTQYNKIIVVNGTIAKKENTSDIQTADNVIASLNSYFPDDPIMTSVASAIIVPNISYDESINEALLADKISQISTSNGVVQKGQIIIEQGDIIDNEKYAALHSFEQKYQQQVLGMSQAKVVRLGYLLLISLCVLSFLFYVMYYHSNTFQGNRAFILLLLLTTSMVLLACFVVKKESFLIYAIPFSIVPIILKTFFNRRLALTAHLLVVLLCGLFVPKPFSFLFIQILAGCVAIYTYRHIRYWSQFFQLVGCIFLTYVILYMGLSLIEEGEYSSVQTEVIGLFAVNILLTFLAYPLIPFFEKLFGLLSDISLVEYTDINKPLLKQLSLEAPGTFQHSLQVANLCEAAAGEIGANALLIKVGALHHDIGKIKNPVYFIENQHVGESPHTALSYQESAQIIIDHVIEGEKMSKKHRLPKVIQDFIVTHHGTSRVEYFYRLHTKENPPENVNEVAFRYPGPKPFTKEHAILMMADSVEAASRSIKNPDQKSLDNLVDSIVDHQIKNNQFDDSPITFQDISLCKAVFKKMLCSIYHIRIEYPEEN